MARLVGEHVGLAGYLVDAVGSIGEAEAALAVARFSLILLDRRLPDGDGLRLMRQIRARQPGTPVIVLSALDDVADKVGGLDAGADDYLTKPFARDELLARMRAALRRPAGEAEPTIRCGRLRFDPALRQVAVGGAGIVLKRRELALVESLIRRAGRVVAREKLMSEVYTFDDDIQSNTLDSHVSRLRRRLNDLDAGVIIHPVRGVGYMLDAV